MSAITGWELGHEEANGRLRLPRSVAEETRRCGFTSLGVTLEPAGPAARLPVHHRDPMDRILIGQAHAERPTILTRDEIFDAHDLDVVRC